MRAAALDLGSNTLRLLTAEAAGRDWRALDRGLAAPRLGAGLKPGGRLSPRAKQAARAAMQGFVQRARDLGAERVVLAATQACRIASDGAEFAAELGREFDLDRARVLTGEEEARLSRLGVLSRLEGPTQGAWLADIGGGSTELAALGREGGALSLPLGAVGLTRGHLAHDPPRPEELAALDRAVARGLAGLGARPARLTATAGTAASLAALLLGHAEYRPDELNNLAVTRGQLERETARLAAMDLRARRSALALEPRRAEIILGGLAILRGLVDIFGLTRFTVMDAGLLEGILLGDGFAPTAGE